MLIITACWMVHQKQEQDNKKRATSCILSNSYTRQGCEVYDTELQKCFARLCPTQLVISIRHYASFSILHRIHKVRARHFPKDIFSSRDSNSQLWSHILGSGPIRPLLMVSIPSAVFQLWTSQPKSEATVTVTGNGERQSCGRRRISTYGIWSHWAWDMSHCLQLLFDPNLLLCVLGCWFNPDLTRPPIGWLCLNL